ncbi:MAG: protein kinase [Acidobacteria bacterium]|nr:protein kinase [Acidobacteriota bacterium]
MEPSRKGAPDALAAALADGAAIDWRAAEGGARGAADANLIHQLRVIAAMRGRHGAAPAARRPWRRQAVAAAYVFGVTLAAIKVIVALAGVPAALAHAPSPVGVFALNLVIFGVGGLLLVFGGTRDRRLQLLGGFYITIAASFVDPFFAGITGPAGMVVAALAVLRPESMFALGVWLFAWSFPAEPLTRRTRRWAGAFIAAAAVVAWGLFVLHLIGAGTFGAPTGTRVRTLLTLFDRQAPRSMYWPVLCLLSAPAVAFLVVRYRIETAERRRRVAWFLGALAVGFTPLIVAVVATPFVPALQDEAVRRRVGLVVYVALGSTVPMTAYAVAVNRVMDLQFVIRTTLQYALARYAIWAAIFGPITYLVLDVVVNRGLTFVQYVNTRHPGGLIAFSGLGLLTLTFRSQLIGVVDRWFLREPLDPAEVLARLERRFRACDSLRGISGALTEELATALHAGRVTVLLLGEDATTLVALDASAPPVPRQSVLCDLLQATRGEVVIDARAALARLLPEADQDWLTATGAHVLLPLVGASGELLGVVAVGAATSDLPYTERHVALATAMCGQAAMQLENRWLRETRPSPAGAPGPRAGGVAWQDEPAASCPNCSETWSPDTRRCRCGTATRPAVLPLFVNAKFRLQRFLGAGGTGVVYLATDMALDRKVAIKTLPPMRREYAERLRREARAMASVRHPNLATIYGAEEWHDTPLLIVEYLEGGTLLDWLARGAMPVDETLDLGIILADVLDRVHGSGVLHRDIKPSNIGYTADGVPKLLDFGLAAMLDRSKGPDAAAAVVPADPAERAARFHDLEASSTLTITHQVVGTPLYLSPEALAGAPPREAFDLWSLHMVLYEAIAGRHPFAGRSVPDVVEAIQRTTVSDIRDVRRDCPAPVAAYLNDALSRVADRRPAAAADVRTALRALRGVVARAGRRHRA